MSLGKRVTLAAARVVVCTVAVVLFVILSSPTAESTGVGISTPTSGQAQPQPEPVPDVGTGRSTYIFKDVTHSVPFANPCTGASGTATTNVHLHAVGSDGSRLHVHLVQPITISATGVVVSFDHLTCG